MYLQYTWISNMNKAIFADPPVSCCVTKTDMIMYSYYCIIVKVEEVLQLLEESGIPQNDSWKIIVNYLKVRDSVLMLHVSIVTCIIIGVHSPLC